jgi:hypothetical protein
MSGDESEAVCALCGRALGKKTEKHHLVPKSKGGRQVVPVHPICHRKIHATFSDAELAVLYHTPERLRDHPDVARFIKWLSGKPADFHKRTAKSKR